MQESPRSEHFDDIYFAVEDGLEETKHVFITGNRLPARWQGRDRFVIAETGFGTGLNFLSAWEEFETTADPAQKLFFISFEKYPLSRDQIANYLSIWKNRLGYRLDRLIQSYPLRVTGWHRISITSQITLILIFDDVLRALPELECEVDAWFLDGHAPAKNPAMWAPEVFSAIGRNSVDGTTFATFTAAGFVRRGLAGVGFEVKKERGFGRKRDMTIGVFRDGRLRSMAPGALSVAVIGGGLAGTATARALYERGHKVTLFEKDHLGAGASGNSRGLYNPRFSANFTREACFYSSAYALAHRTFSKLQNIEIMTSGSLHVLGDETRSRRLTGFFENWGWHEDHVKLLDAGQASECAGVNISQQCIFLPDAGSVNPALVTINLALGIELHCEEVSIMRQQTSHWEINNRHFDHVVVANAALCRKFSELQDLPVSTVRGQIAFVTASQKSVMLKTNLCYGGYLSPPYGKMHILGSTFQPWLTDTAVREEDNFRMLKDLEAIVPSLSNELRISTARAALRTSAKDRFPIGGKLPSHDGLYISVAHGSHGLLSALMTAEHIAATLSGEPPVLPSSAVKALSPARFVKKHT